MADIRLVVRFGDDDVRDSFLQRLLGMRDVGLVTAVPEHAVEVSLTTLDAFDVVRRLANRKGGRIVAESHAAPGPRRRSA